MADESEHLFDAAMALDTRLADKTVKPEDAEDTESDNIPEDATDVPDVRDMTAIRSLSTGSRNQGQ